MADVAEITNARIEVPAPPHDATAEQASLRMRVGSLLGPLIGLLIMSFLGTSSSRLLLGVVVFVFVLNFLVPSGLAQLAIVAPMIIGIVAAFGVGPESNIARGLFVILAYTCGLFNKMILAG